MRRSAAGTDRTQRGAGGAIPLPRWCGLVAVLLLAAHPAAAVQLSGTVTYSGSRGPVSHSLPIRLQLSGSATSLDSIAHTAVATSGGAFTLTVPTAGSYFLWLYLDVNNDGRANVGEPFQIYNQRSAFPADPIAVPNTGLQLTFDDSALLSGIAGTVTYTGSLGQVSAAQRIYVVRSPVADLNHGRKSFFVEKNLAGYDFVTVDTKTYYLEAFLDLNGNHLLDPGEPYVIYQDRDAPPGDPVVAGSDQTGVDLTFGDQYMQSATPTAVDTTPTPRSGTCAAACTGSGPVSVSDILTMVDVVLGSQPFSACVWGDADADGRITVSDILTAVATVLTGCP